MTRVTTAVLVLLVALATPASADVRVRLDAPADVCDPAPMRARIAELVGRDLFVADGDADVAIGVTVDADARGVHAAIVVDDLDDAGDGRRTIDAADCAAVSESAALVIAMVLSRPRPAPEPAPAPPEPPPAAATRVVDPEPIPIPILERDAEAGPPPPRGLEMYGGVAGGRAGRDFQTSVVVGTALRRGRASLGVDFGLAAPDRVSIGAGSVVVTTGVFELAGCLHRGRLAGCATAAVGWAHGNGEALLDARAATTPYAAAGFRLAWDLPFSDSIAARIQLAGRVPFTRNRFLFDDMPMWSTSVVEAWIGLGLVARIP